MGIDFRASPAPTLGVEVEAFLVDAETRGLTDGATQILAELGRAHPLGEHPLAKNELMQCTIEMITGVCDTVSQARVDLESTVAEVRASATSRGWALACAGTHPFSHWSEVTISHKERYQQLVAEIGWPARRLAIHGIHYHVGVPSADAAIAVVNSVAYHLPLFLGLSASSPFWHGLDTGLASARTKIFEALPTAGLPPTLGGWGDFERYMDTLKSAGAITSIREVWWDVRPHPDFGTVELRMCDAMTNLNDVAAVAALAQCLVAELSDRFAGGDELPSAREWVLKENKWLAARYGLDHDMIVNDSGERRPARDLLEETVERLMPTATTLRCSAELNDVRSMARRGSSSDRQRAIIAGGGSLADVIDQLVTEFDSPDAPADAPAKGTLP